MRKSLWIAFAVLMFVGPFCVDVSDAGHWLHIKVKSHATVQGYASDCSASTVADCSASKVSDDCGVKKVRMKTVRIKVPRERVVRHSADCSASVASDCGYSSRVSSDCGISSVKDAPPPSGVVPPPPKE